MGSRRVVVTGMGALSPLGNSVADNWDALLAGQSGVTQLGDRFDVEALSTKIGGLVKAFDPDLSLDTKTQRKLDMFVHYACEVARQAMLDSGLQLDATTSARAGIAFGAGIGGLHWIEKNHDALVKSGPRRVSPFFIPGCIVNMAPGIIAEQHQLKGPILSVVTACATGVHNIGSAARMIAYGDADVMLAGGTESLNSLLTVAGFASAKALSKRNDEPTKASRPFDRDRDGFVVAEGGACLVLEEYEFAKARGANILAEVSGFGMSSDAYHMTLPHPEGEGAINCMKRAIEDAGLNTSDISYINAHGTSTGANDLTETRSIKAVFGEDTQVAVSSTKSMTGHMLGGAGAFESMVSVKTILDQVVPPTINLDNPDEGCDLDYVPHQARKMPVNHVLCNSFGFGGTNACLIFSAIND